MPPTVGRARTPMNGSAAASGPSRRHHRGGAAGPARPAGRGRRGVRSVTPAGRCGLDVGEIDVLAAGVDHQEQPVRRQVGDHQVVDDAAGLVGQQRVALPAGLEARDVAGHQRLQRRRPAAAVQAAPGPCGRRRTAPRRRRRGNAGARPARRRGTAPASTSRRTAPCGRRAPVQRVQRRGLQRAGRPLRVRSRLARHGSALGSSSGPMPEERVTVGRPTGPFDPPLSRNLRDSDGARGPPYSVGASGPGARPAFQRSVFPRGPFA